MDERGSSNESSLGTTCGESSSHENSRGSIFAGFNTNVDVVVHLDKENVSDLINSAGVSIEQVNQIDVSQVHSIQDKNQFVAVVKDCLGKGKSFYIVLDDLLLLDPGPIRSLLTAKELMGGQAGIVPIRWHVYKQNL